MKLKQMKIGQTKISGSEINRSRLDHCSLIQVTEKEGERIAKETGLVIPPPLSKGTPLVHKGKQVGYVSFFDGIAFKDKDFIKKYVKDVLWYVN